MLTISAWISTLVLAQTAAPAAPPMRIFDERMHPVLGHLTLSGGGHRLVLEARQDGSVRSQEFDIDDLPETGRVLSGKVASFVRDGIVVAFAIGEGDSTSYHLLLSSQAPMSPEPVRSGKFSASNPEWSLTRAIFVSTGDPYRIAEVNDPGGDGLEITFRRGWPKLEQPDPVVDEKILCSSCGLAFLGPHVARWRETGEQPWATLVEVSGVRRAGQGN